MIDLPGRLFAIAGNLEPFRVRGGVLTADEVRWLYDQLVMCGQAAAEAASEAKIMGEMLNDLVEQGIADMKPATRGFRPRVIAGGRA